MNVYIKEVKQDFKPVNLILRIETEEELKLLRALFCADLRIPELLYGKNSKEFAHLQRLMEMVSTWL